MFLIDGYNLLHFLGGARFPRERLIELVGAHCRRGGYRARIVFDATSGLRSREQRGDLEIRAVAQGRTADDEIISALAGTEDRTAYRVVTNDLAIVREAEKRKFEVISCEAFARLLVPGGVSLEKREDVPSGEVDYWLREFGLDEC